LNAETRQRYAETVQNGILYTKRAQNFHFSILSRILRMLYNESGFCDLSQSHTDALCTLIRSGKANFRLALPDSFALCERGELRFVHTLPAQENFCLPIAIGSPTALPCGITLLLTKEPQPGAVTLRADALCGNLSVRSRRDGDAITVFGKTHKIKRMISDRKLSAAQKAKLFFLCCGDEILYTNLPATADRAFCRPEDGICIFITAKETL
jgi:tRNA(Ile)-lysidine synthetase-like protein